MVARAYDSLPFFIGRVYAYPGLGALIVDRRGDILLPCITWFVVVEPTEAHTVNRFYPRLLATEERDWRAARSTIKIEISTFKSQPTSTTYIQIYIIFLGIIRIKIVEELS